MNVDNVSQSILHYNIKVKSCKLCSELHPCYMCNERSVLTSPAEPIKWQLYTHKENNIEKGIKQQGQFNCHITKSL